MIDSHCHLEHMKDIEAVIKEAESKMFAVVTSVPDPKDFKKTMKLHDKHKNFVFVAAGFHPQLVDNYNDKKIDDYIKEIKAHADKVVSIGEIGLDYFWIKEPEKQERTRKIFEKFIDLAIELDKPITVHSRNSELEDAITETIEILRRKRVRNVMMHCFSGNDENLNACLDQGWFISYATVLVRSKKHLRLASKTPLEQMLLETDAPWQDPEAKLGSKELTNKPWKIELSAQAIAEVRGLDKQEVLDATIENARNFFRLSV